MTHKTMNNVASEESAFENGPHVQNIFDENTLYLEGARYHITHAT